MPVTLDMIGLVVADISRSLEFYRLLGLEIPPLLEIDSPYVEITLPGGIRLSWNSLELMKSLDPAWVPPAGMRMGLAFLCEDPAGVDALYQKLVDAGYESKHEPFDAFWGQRYATVLDPDGNATDLFAWLSQPDEA